MADFSPFIPSQTISILGCGWLGRPLAVALLRSGYDVNGSTTSREKLRALSAVGIRPYLISFAPEVEGENIEAFFRSRVVVICIPPGRTTTASTDYLIRLHCVCSELVKGGVEKVLFISSTSVYRGKSGAVTETDADRESTGFLAEEIFRQNTSFDTTVIRFGGLVGSGRHPSRFLSGRTVSGGNDPVNLIHLDDCIGVIGTVIRRNFWNIDINACADAHPTRREFYHSVCVANGVPAPHFVPPDNDAAKIVSNKRLRDELGYELKFPDPMTMTY